MHMTDEWIAVVRDRVLEVYIPNGPAYICWRALNLSHTVGSASLSPTESHDHQSASLRLCVTCTDGIFVYDVICDPKREVFSSNLIWHYYKSDTRQHVPALSCGMLGTTGGSVSWLHGSMRDWDFTIRFATARLPAKIGSPQPAVVEWHDDEMPALYALGVYDYDEACGILVIGNAYGELSLYDFSTSDPRLFKSCSSTRLVPAPRTNEKVLSTVRVFVLF